MYVIGSSFERLGEQIASKLCCRFVVIKASQVKKGVYPLIRKGGMYIRFFFFQFSFLLITFIY